MQVTINTIEELRRIRGVNKRDTGLSNQHYQNIITGKNYLTPQATHKIAMSLGVTPEVAEELINNYKFTYLTETTNELTETQKQMIDRYNGERGDA